METIFDFKDTHSGPIFILGNGPSLDEIEDFNKLPYPTFGVNRSWRKIRSKWHFIPPADCYFKELAKGKWKAQYIFTPGRIENAFEKLRLFGKPGAIHKCNFIIVPCNQEVYSKINVTKGEFPFIDFSLSGIMAMETAKYMGFKTFYLLGFDGGHIGYFNTGDKRDKNTTGIDHDKQYFSKIEWRYRRDNVKVYNCNMDSAIMTWPKMPIEEIIDNVKLC